MSRPLFGFRYGSSVKILLPLYVIPAVVMTGFFVVIKPIDVALLLVDIGIAVRFSLSGITVVN